jgi:hypothetical protein
MTWICKVGGEWSRTGPRPCPATKSRHPSPPSPLDRVQEKEGMGEVACAPLRWRLAGASDCSHPHTQRPPSAAAGEDLSPSVCQRRRTEALQTLTILKKEKTLVNRLYILTIILKTLFSHL